MRCFQIILLVGLFGCATETPFDSDPGDWSSYLGGPGRNHFVTLDRFTPENVHRLEVAWTYATADSGQMQTNPLIIDGVLYGVTPTVRAFALDAVTGQELWTFGDAQREWFSTSRGVSYWTDGRGDARIFHSIGPHLYALDAATGHPIPDFGDAGRIDLHTGLPEVAQDKFVIGNTPGTIFDDLIIMPIRTAESAGEAAPGDIRAFDVRTGELVWSFHTIPHPGEPGFETVPPAAHTNTEIGGANCWAGMAVDEARGIVYVPTGSLAYDFHGGNRPGQNLYANCLLALDARTGERRWHYQFTHHDIWDRDLPAPPNLLTVEHNGRRVDAVAQVTKQGFVYVFDRDTGAPLFDILEVYVPTHTLPDREKWWQIPRSMPPAASALPGEIPWSTQPFPQFPKPFARQSYELTPETISPYAPDSTELRERLRGYDTRWYAPPSTRGTVILPGYDGGAEWGGAAADPDSGILYVNSNEMAWILTMEPTPAPDAPELAALTPGARLYQTACAACHGKDPDGAATGNAPSLRGVGERLDRATIGTIIEHGKGMMPGMAWLEVEQRSAVVDYLLGVERREVSTEALPTGERGPIVPYQSTGYHKFLDANGHPAIAPPWGTLAAIDLNTGEFRWQIPLGNEPGLGIEGTGTENYGGPVVTANGLLFIAATKDGMFRCFDKRTGALLWETELPAASFATPSMYAVDGRQFIVLACGGGKLGTPKGNQYVAFTLPPG